MILPHPDSDLTLNIMVMASDLAKILKARNGYILEENLLEAFVKIDERRTPEMFINCLTFLFVFGYIERRGYQVRLSKDAFREPEQLSLEITY